MMSEKEIRDKLSDKVGTLEKRIKKFNEILNENKRK